MDFSVPENTDQALLGLAVLATIPVVLFALWADYYGRYVQAARKNIPGFDPKIERERIRIAGGCVLIFELVLFVGSFDLVEAYPKACGLAIVGCLLAVGFIQAGVENELVPRQLTPASASTPPKRTSSGMKALLFGLMSGFFYVFTLMTFVKASVWIATALQFSTPASASFVMVGAALGIFAGLTLNFALAPWQLKNSLAVTAMTDEEKATVCGSMEKAGLKNFEYWVIEEQQATAAIAGFRGGFGFFRPALFISRKVMSTLSKDEISAVVAHEAAHVLAKHLRKRVLLSASLIVSLTFMALFFTLATFTWLPGSSAQSGAGMFFGVVAFGFAFFILQRQNRVHEFQADWLAVQKLGASFESWATALRKMDQLNGFPLLRGALSSHPRTELRIQNVAKMIEFFGTLKKAEKRTEVSGKDSAA